MKNVFFALFFAYTGVGFSEITPFSLPNMNGGGEMYHSADHKDGIFVLEAYFLKCPYCNINAANVNALAEKYVGNSRVQVLDVGVDRKESDYETWIAKHHPNHPVLKDASRVLISQLGTTGYPSTYVVGCTGRVVYSTSGDWQAGTQAEIEKAISSLEQEECPAR